VCDSHYLGAHVPFIVEMMESTGIARSYKTAKACAQRDLNGTWLQRPEIWRGVAIEVSVPEEGGSMPESSRLAIEEDHRRFLRNLRTYVCRETVMFEDLGGRPATTKFVLEVGARAGRFATAAERVERFTEELSDHLDPATGIALAVADRVRRQEKARAIDEPGQGFTPGEFLDEPDAAAFYELYFVTRRAGEQFFERLSPCLSALAEEPAVGPIRSYRLAEECQVERRPTAAGAETP